jgi:CheY-like chemotaxis protein
MNALLDSVDKHEAQASVSVLRENTRACASCSCERGASRRPPQRCILLVDDEQNILAALRRLLRREGYELLTAASASEAIEQLEAHLVHLIVSDFRMPGVTGVELLQTARARWPNTIRMILSGYSEVSTIIAAVNEGHIYKFLTKPWNDEELKLHIRRAFEQHELEDENRRMAGEITAQNERLRELNTLLEQRAADASTGLASTQTLLEAVGVGVLAVDAEGLVVGANRRVSEFTASGTWELIGIPAELALPETLREFVCTASRPDVGATSCRIELEGRKLQCRLDPLVVEGRHRGSVVALWEEIA